MVSSSIVYRGGVVPDEQSEENISALWKWLEDQKKKGFEKVRFAGSGRKIVTRLSVDDYEGDIFGVSITDELIFQLSGAGPSVPPSYKTYFATGTNPLNWASQPPEIGMLIKDLEDQMLVICEKYARKLTQPVADPNNFLQASVIGQLFQVLIAHESTHLGMIKAMATVLQNE